MPTYEYACKSCGEHVEIVQSFKDDPLTECPSCGGPLRKVFGAIGIAFKGSGFYRTDSRPAPKEATSEGVKGEGAKGDGAKGDGAKAKGDAKSGSEGKSHSDKPKADKQAAASS